MSLKKNVAKPTLRKYLLDLNFTDALCNKKILPEIFLVSQKKIDDSKFSGFPEKCFFFPEKFSDQRIYVYRIKPWCTTVHQK